MFDSTPQITHLISPLDRLLVCHSLPAMLAAFRAHIRRMCRRPSSSFFLRGGRWKSASVVLQSRFIMIRTKKRNWLIESNKARGSSLFFFLSLSPFLLPISKQLEWRSSRQIKQRQPSSSSSSSFSPSFVRSIHSSCRDGERAGEQGQASVRFSCIIHAHTRTYIHTYIHTYIYYIVLHHLHMLPSSRIFLSSTLAHERETASRRCHNECQRVNSTPTAA